ncbi:MAG: elongation factor Ts [Lachnospiraceae bacterium]|nr:elongation factor Ts [Lachnospiraceae bacterium]
MAISAAMVKELREKTGAGMMDCKNALSEVDGNMDEAIELLRKKGVMKAEKKADRIAAEGLCDVVIDGNTAAVVEVNSETDFVAKNEEFQKFVAAVAKQALSTNAADIDAFLAEQWNEDSSKTVKDALTDKVAVIGENLTIRRFEKAVAADGEVLVSYVHGGGRIAVLVKAKAQENDTTKEALSNIAMQIAAMNPKFISEADIDDDYKKHEEEILRAQIENDPKESQKPDKVKEGMIKGRINKQMKEVCLLDQVYVKAEDGKQSVEKYLQSVGDITITQIVRFETGEGLEKKEEDFAAEVAAQIAG